ncbi:MAG TPA: DPP IV N-terminal domain-containing protein [Polyangia bacterium]|nr:DPP IV N-terminal domain-containing protein [Polyangia bacterium]
MLRLRLAVAVVLVFALALTAGRARADDPARVWRTIETPHFYIHFYTLPKGGGEEVVAQRLATVTEYVYSRLTPVLGKGLGRKTHVVVTDEIDDYNGFAGVTPYPAVTLYANSPDDRAELNDYDDWLTDLFMHEYTHVIHTGTIGGWIAPTVNALLGLGLGIVWSPNQTQPRWGLEGLAVFEETARTAAGRLRNAIWDMYLRAQTLEGKFQRIDQISVTPNQWPFGNSAYLYGSALMRYIAEHYGESALLRWSRDYGSPRFRHDFLPGALSRSIRRVTGKTWMQIYDDFKAELTQRYTAQRDAIAKKGITPTHLVLPPEAGSPARPVFTPDGRELIVLRSDGYSRQRMARIPVDAPEPPPIGTKIKWVGTELLTDAAGGPSLSADGRLLAYHEQQVFRTIYYYNDIFLWDRVTHQKTRLTEGKRAWNPALSPDGAWVAFEVTRNSSRGLGLMRTDGDGQGTIEEIVPVANMEHAYTPEWSPDGKTLVFSWWRKNGRRDIYAMDVATRTITAITDDRAYDLEPRFSPDGKLIYFVSDRTGVYNLYAYDRSTKKVWQCTNVVDGVFDPAISPDGKTVAFVGFRALGYTLETAALDPTTWTEAAPPLLDRPDVQPPAEEPPKPTHWYNPFRTLYPFTWKPYATPDGYGEILGIQLSGQDVVGRHSWSLQLGFGTGRADDVQFAANYSYGGLWPSLNMGVSHALERRGGLVINGQELGWDADLWSAGTSVDLPILRHIVDSSDLVFSYDYSWTTNKTAVPSQVIDPSAPVPVLPETGSTAGFGATWTYASTRRYLYSISTESGRYVSLSLGVANRAFGSSHDVYNASWRYNEWIPMPWGNRFLRNHVLWLSYAGGVSGGDVGHHNNFFLGGYPSQNLLTSIYDFSRPGSASLRGYGFASQFGDQFQVVNAEYRFPIMWIERGVDTFPLYLRRLHGKFFVDYGGAFNGTFSFDKLKVGVGGELMLELSYFWYFNAALQLGYAHGFEKGGGNQVYFLLNSPF